MGSFYGWRNKGSGLLMKKYPVSRGMRPCVFLTWRQAENIRDKHSYASFETVEICGGVADE